MTQSMLVTQELIGLALEGVSEDAYVEGHEICYATATVIAFDELGRTIGHRDVCSPGADLSIDCTPEELRVAYMAELVAVKKMLDDRDVDSVKWDSYCEFTLAGLRKK